MKKYIFSAIAALALSCTFVACGDDNNDPSINYDKTAAQGSAGTYSGTWTRTSNTGGPTLIEDYEGSVTLTASNGANATSVTFSCPDASLDATSVANVWHSNYGYQFFNQTVSDANGLEAAFSGRIDEAGNMNVAFTKSQKVGRKNYDFIYEFRGKK
jgi:hypothetical protein